MADIPDLRVIAPIWIAKTRSFWLGILPAILTILDAIMQVFASEASGPVGAIIAQGLQLLGFDVVGDDVSHFMRAMAPVYALIVAQQRRGLNRPYVATPAKEKAAIFAEVK